MNALERALRDDRPKTTTGETPKHLAGEVGGG
jgi:hypothetical protein